MKPEEKKVLIILTIFVLVVIGIEVVIKINKDKKAENNTNIVQEQNDIEEYVQNLEDGSKLNVSDELLKVKMLDGLEIKNIQLKEKGGISTLLADVENKTEKETPEKKIKIEILDKEMNVITTLRGRINKIPVGGKVQLNVAVTGDVSNAYDFRISNQ